MSLGDSVRYSTGSPVSVPKDNPLTTLIRRLEAATSRLEDIASSASSFDPSSNQLEQSGDGFEPSRSAPDLSNTNLAHREASTATVQHVPQSEPLPASIEEMDELLKTEVKSFVDASHGLDPLVEEQVSLRDTF